MELLRKMQNWPGDAPGPSLKEIEELEEAFSPYVFYKKEKKSIHLITTCCHKDAQMPKLFMEETEDLRDFLAAKNNDIVKCPLCGRTVRLKAMGKVGRNVNESIHATFITQRRGKLYALNITAWHEGLQKDITAHCYQAVEYTPGHVKTWTYSYFSQSYHAREYDKWSRKDQPSYLPEWMIIGWDNIEKTPFRYVPEPYSSAMRYLFVAAFYPQQVEMLEKTGWHELVDDLIWQRRKNKCIFDWDAKTIQKAWKVSKEDIQKVRNTRYSSRWTLSQIATWKKKEPALKTDYILENLGLIKDIKENLPKSITIPTVKAVNYIKKQEVFRTDYEAITTWRDYLEAVVRLNRNIEEERVIFPKNLQVAHDEAVEERNLLEERLKAEEDAKKVKANLAGLKKRSKKFDFEFGEMFIRVAMSPAEIRAEGNVLKHCVGGYAERHIAGKTTILFMRKLSEPDTPLYTVEVDKEGNIVQAHGYRNEWDGQEPPLKKYKSFFETWRTWYTHGSKRRKDGTPIVPKMKGASA